jgi:hypothetical protein
VDELEGERGKGKGAYVIFRIRGGVGERLWGIPRGIPDYRRSRGVTRRGEARGGEETVKWCLFWAISNLGL